MLTKITNAKIVLPDGVVFGSVIARDGIIEDVFKGNCCEAVACDEVVDAEGGYLLAGFIDLHCHGGFGFDFMESTPEQIHNIERFHLSHGTTTLVATTLTDEWQYIEAALENIGKALENPIILHGAHLEGPWFSPSQCGAQSVETMCLPSPEKLADIVERFPFVERFSLAPEIDLNFATVKKGIELGRVIALGHTDADFDTTIAAIDNGYTLATHLYSGMRGVIRVNAYRVAGAVEACLYDDRIVTEVIADGKHLPAGLLKLIYKCKGADNICLITDAMCCSGFADGETAILGRKASGNICIIEDGVAKLPDRTAFAGSIASTDRLLRTMVNLAGIPISEVSKMLSPTPARVMGYNDRGRIERGLRADFVIMNDALEVTSVILGAKVQKF